MNCTVLTYSAAPGGELGVIVCLFKENNILHTQGCSQQACCYQNWRLVRLGQAFLLFECYFSGRMLHAEVWLTQLHS